jgi:hypothetical protein
MAQCYLLAAAVGSSVDQQSNNMSLFSLVEQINVPPGFPPPPDTKIPLEVHAYFRFQPHELGQNIELRFVLRASTGLETSGETITHRIASPRIRMRAMGLPVPPVLGHYDLAVDFRIGDAPEWTRDPLTWPVAILETPTTPRVTH